MGFDGGSKNDPKEEVICYDYQVTLTANFASLCHLVKLTEMHWQAHDSDCPLLLSSPRGASRKDVAKKVRNPLLFPMDSIPSMLTHTPSLTYPRILVVAMQVSRARLKQRRHKRCRLVARNAAI